jgi:hypothetical protein
MKPPFAGDILLLKIALKLYINVNYFGNKKDNN